MSITGLQERKPRVVLIGGGVHAVVVTDCIRSGGRALVEGYADTPEHDRTHLRRMSVPYLGDDPRAIELIHEGRIDAAILGLAGIDHAELRRRLAARFDDHIHRWWAAVHPHATVAESAYVGPGSAVLARAVVNPLARVGRHCVVNTAAVVEHHCLVEDFAVVSPNATLCGLVHVGEGAFIGAGATVITGVSVGAHSIVGAGAVVIRDVPEGVVAVGNPARLLERGDRLAPETLLELSA